MFFNTYQFLSDQQKESNGKKFEMQNFKNTFYVAFLLFDLQITLSVLTHKLY